MAVLPGMNRLGTTLALVLAVTGASACTATGSTVAPPGCEPIQSEGICQIERVHRDRAGLVALGGGAPEDSGPLAWADVRGCGLPSHVFAWDDDDVYVLSPQSCGPSSCDEHFTGYYWKPLGVEDPSSFEWLSGGYARDANNVYNRWSEGPVPHADVDGFEVMACEPYGQPIGASHGRYFQDGDPLDGPPEFTRG